LPRCRSGCKDAIIFNAGQGLFSLFLASFFTIEFFEKTPLFFQSGHKYTEISDISQKIFTKKQTPVYNSL